MNTRPILEDTATGLIISNCSFNHIAERTGRAAITIQRWAKAGGKKMDGNWKIHFDAIKYNQHGKR